MIGLSRDELLHAERDLVRFELGESGLVPSVAPVETRDLDRLGSRFAAVHDATGDLRYLSAVMKMLDRSSFAAGHLEEHRALSAWADAAVQAVRLSWGAQ